MAVDVLKSIENWLAVSVPPESADMIFSLAGGRGRKEFALRLLREGYAPAVLLSTGRFEIRRFSQLNLAVEEDVVGIARALPPSRRHFFALYDGSAVQPHWIETGFFGTMSEIVALQKWLEAQAGIRSLLIVSSGFHLRRIAMCCRALLPSAIRVRLCAVPETEGAWSYRGRTRLRLLLREILKIAVYGLVLRSRRLQKQPGG